MKKNDKKNIKLITIILVVIFVILAFDMTRFKILTTIDFSTCKEKCNYNLFVGNKVYKLKYEKTDNEHGVFPGFIGKIYLDKINIMTTEEYGEIRNVQVFKDLLVFTEHIGTSADGDTIKIYNKDGKLLKSIYMLDEKTGMHISPYYNGDSASKYISMEDDNLILYGTMRYDSGMLYVNGEYYEGYFQTNLSEMVDGGALLITDPFAASYKISYDDIIVGGDLKLNEVIKTVGNLLDETN